MGFFVYILDAEGYQYALDRLKGRFSFIAGRTKGKSLLSYGREPSSTLGPASNSPEMRSLRPTALRSRLLLVSRKAGMKAKSQRWGLALRT